MPGKHLTLIERGKIEAFLSEDKSQTYIANALRRSQSAISRELSRCPKGQYCAEKAQKDYNRNRQACGRTPTLEHVELANYVREKLVDDYSPEQISGTIQLDYPSEHRMRISHETIYLTLYNDSKWKCFLKYLRGNRKKRRKRTGKYNKRAHIPNRIGIEQRPFEVDALEVPGHWEGDTIIGANHEGAIVTLVERKYNLLRAIWVPCRKAKGVAEAIIEVMNDVPKHLLKTITFDNGLEFANHQTISSALGVDIYFADPYSSWQRARNENMNGLLRQYFPKKTSFKNLIQEEVKYAVKKLNNRPRKKHGFRSPNVFFEKLCLCT